MTFQNEYPWWKQTTVYQIYPRSYQDSNQDGIGDLEGIISRLDYIQETGFETIWFSPFYESPQKDFGYDISGYRVPAAEYGTMETVDRLIEEIHVRDMRIVLDLVLNHTSDRHPWFLESRSSRENPKRGWYIWRDGKKPEGGAPPNNWKSKVTGSGWHYDALTGQWYWAAFLPCQPDLNYRNPEVREEMFDMIRFWLRKGADGFRLDILGSLFEDEAFRDNPFAFKLFPSADDEEMLFRSTKMTSNHPDTFAFVKELRKVVDEFSTPRRFLVGEVFGGMDLMRKYCGTAEPDGLHQVFLFKTLQAKFSAGVFKKMILEFERYFPEPFIPTWVFSNHDRFRRSMVLGDNPEKIKLNTAFLFTVRGVPYMYYGEEIGMSQFEMGFRNALDSVSKQFEKLPPVILKWLQKVTGGAVNRDGCRTPMQWDGTGNSGFCAEDVRPWLPVHPNHTECNVERELNDPGSILHCCRRFLAVRKDSPALRKGDLTILEKPDIPPTVLCYKRESEEQKVYIFLNFSRKSASVPVPAPGARLIVSTRHTGTEMDASSITLQPFEGAVFQTA